MASIIGHAFGGLLAGQTAKINLSTRKERLLLCTLVCLATLPDLDIIIYIIFEPSGMIPHITRYSIYFGSSLYFDTIDGVIFWNS